MARPEKASTPQGIGGVLVFWTETLGKNLGRRPVATFRRNDLLRFFQLIHRLVDLLAVEPAELGDLPGVERLACLTHNRQYLFRNIHRSPPLQVQVMATNIQSFYP